MLPKLRNVHRLLLWENYRSITSVLSNVFERLVLFVCDDLRNIVVCFQLPSLLIGEVLVPVMFFCAHPIQFNTLQWAVG